jgi:DNA repair protein RadC
MAKIKDPQTDKNIHDGRREKLRQRFLRDGLQTFNETEVIEYALGLTIKRQDTNPTAHRLFAAFGSLAGVIDAHPDKLKAVAGIGDECAIFLNFLQQFVTYYQRCAKGKGVRIKSPEDAIKHLAAVMATYTSEVFVLLLLDTKNQIISEQTVTSNSLDKVELNLRELVDTAFRVKCHSIIIAHNHLNDDPNPSPADVVLTRTLLNVLTPLNIHLIDHIVFAGCENFSFARSHTLDAFRREHKSFSAGDDYKDYL